MLAPPSLFILVSNHRACVCYVLTPRGKNHNCSSPERVFLCQRTSTCIQCVYRSNNNLSQEHYSTHNLHTYSAADIKPTKLTVSKYGGDNYLCFRSTSCVQLSSLCLLQEAIPTENPNKQDNDILENARYYFDSVDWFRQHVNFRADAERFYSFETQLGLLFGNKTGRQLLIETSKFLFEQLSALIMHFKLRTALTRNLMNILQ